jgi:hypothetical protein
MRRHSREGREPAKARRRKTVTRKRRNATKPGRELARVIRERDEALEQQAAISDIALSCVWLLARPLADLADWPPPGRSVPRRFELLPGADRRVQLFIGGQCCRCRKPTRCGIDSGYQQLNH